MGDSYATGEVVYTVPTGYYLFLTNINVCGCDTKAAPSGAFIAVGIGATDIFVECLLDVVRYRPSSTSVTYAEPIIIDSGRVIKMFCSGGIDIYGITNMAGYLVKKQQESA